MVRVLNAASPGFTQEFRTLLSDKLENDPKINATVAAIVEDIRTRGDDALIEYTNRFDRVKITAPAELRINPAKIKQAYDACDPKLIEALKLAASRITKYHEGQMPEGKRYTDETGTTLGFRWSSVDAAGLYVPGGLASYPSSVLMNGIPAKVAGVSRIAMVVPAPDGVLNPLVLAAAHIVGINEIYSVGGAQAIAALAYGTQTIKPVNMIVGPGNAYVAAAKRQLFGVVGIDMIAGPSEILLVSDNKSNPSWIAADLLSQAEHDTAARSILITNDAAFGDKVIAEVERLLRTLPREKIARISWENNGAVIIVKDWDVALPLIDQIATEHLELAIDNPEALASRVRHAGAIFLGRYTPEAIGDYTAGPSHVLPTASTAAFSSGLSVFNFLKRTSMIACTENSFRALAESTRLLAEAEGLGAHALSITIRNPS
ncbi:MAG: hisD [Rickettsiales bacterium]|jgi:histidinol dehydrogenase|nr:hisD [Rickettsiales bacterium]